MATVPAPVDLGDREKEQLISGKKSLEMELLAFVLARRPTIFNLNSYEHSGLANHKTVTIQPGGKDSSVLLVTTKTKRQNKPSALFHKSLLKKEFPRMAKVVTNQVADNYYRPDLKVNRSLKVAMSGVQKRNRQAAKTPSRK